MKKTKKTISPSEICRKYYEKWNSCSSPFFDEFNKVDWKDKQSIYILFQAVCILHEKDIIYCFRRGEPSVSTRESFLCQIDILLDVDDKNGEIDHLLEDNDKEMLELVQDFSTNSEQWPECEFFQVLRAESTFEDLIINSTFQDLLEFHFEEFKYALKTVLSEKQGIDPEEDPNDE